MTSIVESTTLTPAEKTALQSAEERIEKGMKFFLQVGAELLRIRDGRLYREQYETFEEYLSKRWDIARSTGYQYMNGFIVAENIKTSTAVDKLPDKVSHTRLLEKFIPEVQVQLWASAVTIAGGEDKSVQAKHINQAIATYEDEKRREQVRQSNYPLIAQEMIKGQYSSKTALEIIDCLATLKPKVRGDMLRALVRDTALMRLMNEKTHTDTYQEAISTGHIEVWYEDIKDYHQLPLARCGAKHFQDALNRAYHEHMRQLATTREASQGVRRVSGWFVLGDGKQMINELIQAGASNDDLQDLLLSLFDYFDEITDNDKVIHILDNVDKVSKRFHSHKFPVPEERGPHMTQH